MLLDEVWCVDHGCLEHSKHLERHVILSWFRLLNPTSSSIVFFLCYALFKDSYMGKNESLVGNRRCYPKAGFPGWMIICLCFLSPYL